MKAERDELTLQVFPILRKVCEERGISWGEVDLRWGIPEEKKGEVLSTCLKFIDDCRPYFIGILGERYGWIDSSIPDNVKDDYPWVKEHADKSITELEILHGVLRKPEMEAHAFFYFRDKAYLESEKFKVAVKEEDRANFFEINGELSQKLADLKKRILDSGFPVKENYPDPVRFGEFVKEDLMRVIDKLAPRPAPLTEEEQSSAALDREDMAHEAFAASRFGIYIPRQEYFNRLDAHASDDGQPLMILGESGSGKSALLAHWAFRYRAQHPDDLVLVHFVGASSKSTDWAFMLRRFMGEFKRHFSMTEEIPAQNDALIVAFANWLSMAGAHGRVILIIDSLNQLDDRNGAPDLVWLPPTIPENICLVLSTLPGRPLDAFRKRKWPTMDVEPLTVSERNALITCYLKKYHKALSIGAKEELASAPQCEKPLFLRALLEEVRIHGVFEKLIDQIRNYLTAQTVDALYDMILARYESDYDRDRHGLVKDAVSLIWAARRGLSKAELMDLLGANGKPLPDAYWAPLYLAMEHSLIEKGGLITFFHDYFKQAVSRRYFLEDNDINNIRIKLATYFYTQEISPRKIEELPFQLSELKEWGKLKSLLSDSEFFIRAWDFDQFTLKHYFSEIENYGKISIPKLFETQITSPTKYHPEFIERLVRLLDDMGYSKEIFSLVTILKKLYWNKKLFEKLMWLLNLQMFYSDGVGGSEKLQYIREMEEICILIPDRKHIAQYKYNMAKIFKDLDNFTQAMHLLKETELICKETNDQYGLQLSLGLQANILARLGQYQEAIKLYETKEQIARQLGNIETLVSTLGNHTITLLQMNDFGNIGKLLDEMEQKARYIGDINNLQACLGYKAELAIIRNEVDNAINYLDERGEICKQSNNITWICQNQGMYARISMIKGDLLNAWRIYQQIENTLKEMHQCNELRIANLFNQAVLLHIYCKKPEKAFPLYKKVYDLAHEKNLSYLAERVDPYIKKSQLEIARLQYNKLDNEKSINTEKIDSAVILNDQGCVLEIEGKLDDALNMYEKALAINPHYAKAWNNKGVIFSKKLKFEDAIAAFNRATNINPSDAQAWSNLGSVYMETGRDNEAIASYERAISINPNRPEFHYLKGLALKKVGKNAEALEEYEKVLLIQPNYIFARAEIEEIKRR
jgi:tetratricopeptide (TPR) repeat protein